MLEVILDTETTGLSTASDHRIVEFGCIELKDQIPTNKIFHEHLNPERNISKDAFDIHGYTAEFLADKKVFSETNVDEDFIENFFKNSGFQDNLKVYFEQNETTVSGLTNRLLQEMYEIAEEADIGFDDLVEWMIKDASCNR